MKTKLMISALLFCSSLSIAADSPTSAPAPTIEKKKTKPAPTADKEQRIDEAVFGGGGLGTSGLGTGGSSAPMKLRGKGTAAVRK